MKKRVLLILAFLMVISSVACQKTPEKQVVVNKSQGLAETDIVPKEENGVAKELNVPEHWNETLTKKEGLMTLKADVDIQIPDIYNSPVYAYEIQPMEQEFLEKLCNYFADKNDLYENPEFTQEELAIEKQRIIDGVGNWGAYEDNYVQSMIGRIESKMEQAPEKQQTLKSVDIKLTKPQAVGMEVIGKSWYNATHKRTWNDWYYETDKAVGFTARIKSGKKMDPIIRALNYDDEVGSTTSFAYRQGTFIDEIELSLESDLEQAFEHGKENYLNFLYENMQKLRDDTFTKDEAIQEAKCVLDELGIQGMAVEECVEAIGNPYSESWAGVGTDDTEMCTGYAVYFSVQAGDLVGYPLTLASNPYENLTETVYAPSFITEGIRMIVTEEGIQLFEWTNISERTKVVAENTRLLTFDEVKERLAEHLLYAQVSQLGGINPEGFTNIYIVKNVKLRAANINAYDAPQTAWLVPVWVFELNWEMTYEMEEDVINEKLGPETVVLNAIDGGFIQVPNE